MEGVNENAGSHLKLLKEGDNSLQNRTSPADEPIEEVIDKVPRNHSSVVALSSPSNPKEAKSTCGKCSEEPESSHTPINAQPEVNDIILLKAHFSSSL